MNKELLLARISDYLQSGGLFNPEMMEHDKVRALILDIQTYLHENQISQKSEDIN
jgi:hypothetical protein